MLLELTRRTALALLKSHVSRRVDLAAAAHRLAFLKCAELYLRTHLIRIALSFAIVLALHARASDVDCAHDCGFEQEPVLDAAAIVAPSLLSGPNFLVAPQVQVGGYMARFQINTSFGPLQADSAQMLAIRVAEVPAIETLERASHVGAFADALAEKGKKTGNSIIKVVSHPVDSIIGLPLGVARYFKKRLDTWTARAQSLTDRSSRVMENRGDPFRAPSGPMTTGRDVPPVTTTTPTSPQADASLVRDADVPADDESETAEAAGAAAADVGADQPKKSHAWYARAGNEIAREAKRYLKYNQARRELAKRLGIDPNTSNPYVNERMDSLAWAAVGGNFSAGEALSAITGGAADVITDTGKIDQFVLTHDPEEVRERNEKNLLNLCSDAFGVRLFATRGGFNDTLRAQLVTSLQKLKPATGCNELLELAATTRGEVEARYLVDALALLVEHVSEPAGGGLVVAGAALVYVVPSKKRGARAITPGQLYLPLPVDYLTWSHDIDVFFDRQEFARADKTVLIGGDASMLAQRNITARGWSLQLRAAYAGAPKYAAGEFDGESR